MTLRAAAALIDITPPVGAPTANKNAVPATTAILGSLQAGLLLFDSGNRRLCLISAETFVAGSFGQAIRRAVAEVLGIRADAVLVAETHNHSCPAPCGQYEFDPLGSLHLPQESAYHRRLKEDVVAAAAALPAKLESVRLSRGRALEYSLTYQRKRRRGNGTTYLLRDHDPAWVGLIDPELIVVRCERLDGSPLAVMVNFSGHPATTLNLNRPVVDPDVAGRAIRHLTAHLGGPELPYLYLTGFSGDINFRHFLGGPERAETLALGLAQRMVEACAALEPVSGATIAARSSHSAIPLAPLPARAALEAEKAELLEFIDRVHAEETLGREMEVVGYNFSRTMTSYHKANIARMMLGWTEWALDHHTRQQPFPKELIIPLQAMRIGDLALMTWPAEPFAALGVAVKRRSPFPVTLTVGTANGTFGYVGGVDDVRDQDYMSAFYRHTHFLPPFAPPAGDALVEQSIALLDRLRAES